VSEDPQNRFYTSISEFYSGIFPYNPLQLEFIQSRLDDITGKKVLDIGCATGELAFQMAVRGARVTGIDLNGDLLQQARNHKQHPGLSFQKGDMLQLPTDFKGQSFDAVICFGNTLVHLSSADAVHETLTGVRKVLHPGGRFFLQILNYDHIFGNSITKLPLIETDQIIFLRSYQFESDAAHVKFLTELYIKSTGETIKNETELLALRSDQLKSGLEQAGFSEIDFYSGFKGEPAGGNHLPLVVCCS
jgi:glycine/sarcosine N-methyltransferase